MTKEGQAVTTEGQAVTSGALLLLLLVLLLAVRLLLLMLMLLLAVVLAMVLALVLVVLVAVVAPRLADARGRKPPRLATRAGENKECDACGGGGGGCGGIRVACCCSCPRLSPSFSWQLPRHYQAALGVGLWALIFDL